jgi:hypothetical protein
MIMKKITYLLLIMAFAFTSLMQAQDTDGDGVPDSIDLDADNDGITNEGEGKCPNGSIDNPIADLGDAYLFASGRYYFNLNGRTFQAEIDNSEGGGWILILQYIHQGGTNPNLNTLGANDDFPVLSNSSLGDDDSGNPALFAHAGNALLNQLGEADEFRFFGRTSGHNRIIHFTTTTGVNYAKTGAGGFSNLENNFTPLSGHNANAPASTNDRENDFGDSALTEYPFYTRANFHWGIRGRGTRWEVDDYPNNSSRSTIHKIWIRSSTANSSCTPRDSDGDGTPDYLDSDSDGDGCSDANEYYEIPNADEDGNGFYGTGTPAVDTDGLVEDAGYDGTGLSKVYDDTSIGGCVFVQDTDGNWDSANNWNFDLVPQIFNDVIIQSQSTITQDQQINNLTVDPSYSVNVNSGQVLNVSGDLDNNGDFAGDGEVVLNGTSAQAISGTGSFENLRLDNSISVSIDNPDNTPINLNGVLYVDQGILNTDNNLYLRCAFGTTGTPGTPPKTAQVGQVASGSSINGDVTVEQCFPARRAFRLISPSVTTTTTINANWQEGVNNPNTTGNLNPNPGYGTHITGSETGADGFDATGSGNPSLFTFNNVGRSWEAISNTDVNTLDANQPYRLFIRGGRDINVTNNSSDPTPTKLRVTGALETGEQFQTDLSSTAGSFNLIANPYHAQVDMRLLTASSTNISNTEYYVWDPTLGGAPTVGQTGGRGAYVTVNLSDGSTSFLDTGISGSPSNTANEFLQPMQAAFVLVNGSGASVDFEESHKDVSPVQTETKSLSQSEYINIQLFDSDSYNSGETPSDGLRINFDKSFSAASEDDSPKLGNLDENLARIKGNAYSAIERRPFPETEERLELFINQYRREAYVMKFNLTDNLNTKVFIEDKYLNQTQEITSSDDIYSFTVDESISESTASDRFSLVFEPISLSTVEETLVEASLYPNPTKGSFRISGANLGEDAKIEIYNMIGQQVYKTNLKNQSTTEITNFNGSAGVYLVKLKTNQGERTFKLIKQ